MNANYNNRKDSVNGFYKSGIEYEDGEKSPVMGYVVLVTLLTIAAGLFYVISGLM